LQMAGECSRYGLTDLAQAHFQRVLDLDPENKPARIAAGYDKDQNGRWVKQEVVMSERRGKVQHRGRWRFPESVAIEQERESAKQVVADATRDLVRWHRAAMNASGKRYEEAISGLQQINDPLTIGTLSEYLLDTRKPPALNLKMLYVRLLSQFESFDAARTLATAAVLDPYPQVRNACLDSLSRFGSEVAIPIFASYLQSDNNALINIAAEGIGQLNGKNAVLPLIDAVVSTHSQQVGSDGMNASPTSGSFSMGGKKTIKVPVNNQAVLGTLAQLTGQNFGFDKDRWMMWYATTKAAPVTDLRRDP
jgi:tetratricopeptide (TPR) repeat protein